MPYIDSNKIKLDALTWLDDGNDILVPLVDVKKAIAQTPTEDVVLRAELSILSVQYAAHTTRLEEENAALKVGIKVLGDTLKSYERNEQLQEDVVKVVRCKDCEYGIAEDYEHNLYSCGGYPDGIGGYINGESFCSEGKRKEQL